MPSQIRSRMSSNSGVSAVLICTWSPTAAVRAAWSDPIQGCLPLREDGTQRHCPRHPNGADRCRHPSAFEGHHVQKGRLRRDCARTQIGRLLLLSPYGVSTSAVLIASSRPAESSSGRLPVRHQRSRTETTSDAGDAAPPPRPLFGMLSPLRNRNLNVTVYGPPSGSKAVPGLFDMKHL